MELLAKLQKTLALHFFVVGKSIHTICDILPFCLQEKPLAKSLQRGEDPQFDQVSTVKCNGLRLAVKGIYSADKQQHCSPPSLY